MPDDAARADVGVFGGSGFYSFAHDAPTVSVDTPWGAPSAPLTIVDVDGIDVAFLPRHGVHHEFPAHRVDYRANIAAMRALGVRALFAPFAAGSLRPDLRPGDLVVVDQLVDRTHGRVDTFHHHFTEGPQHVSLADPYDDELRHVLVDSTRAEGATVHDSGTVVVINGWDLVNMTQYPEAALAREAGVPYAGLALVTDYDAGLEHDPTIEPVSQEQVFARFEQNLERLRAVLMRAAGVVARSASTTTPRQAPTPLPAP